MAMYDEFIVIDCNGKSQFRVLKTRPSDFRDRSTLIVGGEIQCHCWKYLCCMWFEALEPFNDGRIDMTKDGSHGLTWAAKNNCLTPTRNLCTARTASYFLTLQEGFHSLSYLPRLAYKDYAPECMETCILK